VKPTTTRLLLFTGILIPAVFWISTIIAAKVYGNYSHCRDTISDLGAIGAPSETIMNFSAWTCVVLSIGFLIGLVNGCRQLKINKAPLIGVLGFSIMFAWAAAFHAGNSMHDKSGPVLLLILLGPLLSLFLWRGKELKTLRMLSLLSLIIMLSILLRVILSDTFNYNYAGLIQRFVHFGWSIWFISLSLTFLTLLNKIPNIKADR
jgi:hypothetical membrane protein